MYHMAISQQEAFFLEEILSKHLDDYVEELTRDKFSNPDSDQTKVYHFYRTHREAGVSLLSKAKETIRRSTSLSGTWGSQDP